MKIHAFKGEYQVFDAKDIKIEMFCCVCKKWVTPNKLMLGKAHIYGTHCGVMQELASVFFKEA